MNPKNNRFNDIDPMREQIDLPTSMLSRFDLIFAIRDKIDEVEDNTKTTNSESFSFNDAGGSGVAAFDYFHYDYDGPKN